MTRGYYQDPLKRVEPLQIKTWKAYCCRMWIMPWLGSAAPSAGTCGVCGEQPQPDDQAYFVLRLAAETYEHPEYFEYAERQAHEAIERYIEEAGMLHWETPRVKYVECLVGMGSRVEWVPLEWITERDRIYEYKVCWVARAVKLDD